MPPPPSQRTTRKPGITGSGGRPAGACPSSPVRDCRGRFGCGWGASGSGGVPDDDGEAGTDTGNVSRRKWDRTPLYQIGRANGSGGRYTQPRTPRTISMRRVFSIGLAFLLAAPVAAAPLDPESKGGYHLRVVVRTGDHPTLTAHFRAEVVKGVTSALPGGARPVRDGRGDRPERPAGRPA